MYQTWTYLFSSRNVQGNESWKDSWLAKKLTSHVRGKLFVIADIQVLHRVSQKHVQLITFDRTLQNKSIYITFLLLCFHIFLEVFCNKFREKEAPKRRNRFSANQ